VLMTQVQHKNILSYSGNLSFEKINELLELYNVEAIELGINPVTQKRLFSILVETLENAYRHKVLSIDKEKYNKVDFSLTYTDTDIEVNIGNYTVPENAEQVSVKLDMLNKLSVKGISSLYKESIAKAKISAKGGAGLGLIEIARNSRQIMKYNITSVQSSIVYFEFNIIISQNPKKEK